MSPPRIFTGVFLLVHPCGTGHLLDRPDVRATCAGRSIHTDEDAVTPTLCTNLASDFIAAFGVRLRSSNHHLSVEAFRRHFL